ncbi:tectonin domain-containing protein, partial [Salmonella sp. s54925]|uniref:tectonin domain-containing protein n=1 Tax=Salmonella sp. s54925 TaxID=3159674 RepID=UPI003980492C
RNRQKSWNNLPGVTFTQIDSGPAGVVYGVNTHGEMFCRGGIPPGKPDGDTWVRVKDPVGMRYASCGAVGCMGVNGTGHVWYGHGESRWDFAGTGW